MTRAELGVLAAILVAATLFVAWDPGSYVFERDPAELAETGRDIAAGRALPLAGTNVAGGAAGRWLGPLLYYTVAVPFFISSSITFAALFFGGLYVLSVLLLWSSARALFDPLTALVAAALFAANAHALVELRLNFPSTIAPFVVLALFRACIAWGPRGKPDAVLWVAALAGVLIQLHVVHVAFFGLVATTAIAHRPKWPKRPLAIGIGFALALQVPWVIEQANTGGRDIRDMLAWIGSSEEGHSTFDAGAGLRVLGNAFAARYRIPLDVLDAQSLSVRWYESAASVLLAASTVVGAVSMAIDERHRKTLAIITAWLGGPLVLFAVAQAGVYSFHLVSVLPVFSLLAGVGLARVLAPLGRARFAAAAAIVVPIVVVQGALLYRVAKAAETQGYARIPMSAVLSYPDEVFRFPVDVAFPTLRDTERVERLVRQVSLAPDTRGMIHGPIAMRLSHHPPFFPTTRLDSEQAPAPRSAHHFLGLGDACTERSDALREGPYCLWALPASWIYDGFTALLAGQPSSSAVAFPASGEPDAMLTRAIEEGTSGTLTIWTLGPVANRMDEPTAPEIEVRLGGDEIVPRNVEIDAPFYVRSTRTYGITADETTALEIRLSGEGGYDLDLVFEPER